MKFQIRRTALFEEESPCPEARKETYTRVQSFSEKVMKERPNLKAMWFDFGENHRTKDGILLRDSIQIVWVIEIDTLEDLKRFSEKYGQLVFSCTKEFQEYGAPTMALEIYDDWRE